MTIWIPTMRRDDCEDSDLYLGDAYLTSDAAHTAIAKMQARVTQIRVAMDVFNQKIEKWLEKNPYPEGGEARRLHNQKLNANYPTWREELGLKKTGTEKYPDLFNISECHLFGTMAFEVREIEVRNE